VASRSNPQRCGELLESERGLGQNQGANTRCQPVLRLLLFRHHAYVCKL